MSKNHSDKISASRKVTLLLAGLVCVAAMLPISSLEVSPAVHAQQGCTPPKNPFQLVAQQFSKNAPPNDVNGFLLNPQWQWQVSCPPSMEGGRPTPTLDNYPDSINPEMCRNKQFDDCTGEVKQTAFDSVGICPMCNLGRRRKNRDLGHVNWFTVTYTGDVCFHNTSYPDLDYTFSLRPKMGAGLTRWNHPSKPDRDGNPIDPKQLPQAIHVEFDSRETVNLFRSKTWSEFRNNASPCRWWDFRNPCHADDAMNMISRRRAVVIGLMGLDSEHDIYSESHPVYAMAIEVNSDPDDNTWIVFARNNGTEGNCSHLTHPLNSRDGQLMKTLKLLIPPPDGVTVKDVSARATQFFSNNDTCPQLGYYTDDQYSEDNEGVLITFDLQSCAQGSSPCDSLVEGEIHLNWTFQGTPAAKVQAQAVDRCLVLDEEEQAEDQKKYKDPSPTQAVRLMQLLEEERAAGARSMNRCQSLANGPIPRVQVTQQQKDLQINTVMTTAIREADQDKDKDKAKAHFKKISDILFPN